MIHWFKMLLVRSNYLFYSNSKHFFNADENKSTEGGRWQRGVAAALSRQLPPFVCRLCEQGPAQLQFW